MIYLFDFRKPSNPDKTAFYILVKDGKQTKRRIVTIQHMKAWSKEQSIKVFEVRRTDGHDRAWDDDEARDLVDRIIAKQQEQAS